MKTRHLARAALAASAVLTPLAHASGLSANPFAVQGLNNGYQLAQADMKQQDGKCGEAKCGADKKASRAGAGKQADGKCGEAKCGADKDKSAGKTTDAGCGAKK